jgi:hypothetical protein
LSCEPRGPSAVCIDSRCVEENNHANKLIIQAASLFIFANKETAESSTCCGEQAKLHDEAELNVSLGALDQARNTFFNKRLLRTWSV